MNNISSVASVPLVNMLNPTGDVIPTLIHSHSDRFQHQTFIGGIKSDDPKRRMTRILVIDEFHETVIDDDFEEIDMWEDKIENKVTNNPLYSDVKIVQWLYIHSADYITSHSIVVHSAM